MLKLLHYLKEYKKESIIGPLFKLLEASFELFVPLVMASIIDIGIKNRDISHIVKMGTVMVGLGLFGLICSLTAQYFAAKAAVGFGTNLRKQLFAHIQRLSYKELDHIGTSTLITRITHDINQVQSVVNLVLRLFMRSPFIVIGAVVMAFLIHVRVSLVFVIAMPVLAIVIYGIMGITMPIYKRVQGKLDTVLKATRENLAGIRVIRAFSRQKQETQGFEESSSQLMKTQLLVGRISALFNPATYVVANAAIIAILWYGAYEVYEGEITQGQVVALVNYMIQILLALVALANLIISFTKAMASASRIQTVFSVAPGIIESNTNPIHTRVSGIEFRKVGFTYHGAKEESLSDISFRLEKGEVLGVIGGTGSGKSTLIQLIPRFYEATSGSVLVDGEDVKNYSLKQLRDKIGLVPQHAVLFKGTIRENLKWGRKDATEEEMEAALDIAQVRDFVAPSKGLDKKILQGGKNISGGQRQRLTIARALVKRPEILVLDDSASALDYITDARLRKAIAEKLQGITLIIASQRTASIRHADKILVLDDGKMAGFGKHEDLMQHCDVYREICLSQYQEKEAVL